MLGGKSPANDTSDCGHSIVGGRLSIVGNPDTSFETGLILLEPHGKQIQSSSLAGMCHRKTYKYTRTHNQFYSSTGTIALQLRDRVLPKLTLI